jgi:hypothetical protein
MPTNHNSAGSNLSPGRNRHHRERLQDLLEAVETRAKKRREEDWSRRANLAAVRYAIGDRSQALLDNYRPQDDYKGIWYYETLLRYRSPELTLTWVEQYLGKMSFAELLSWLNERRAIVRHLERTAPLVDVQKYNPYIDSSEHMQITKHKFLFDTTYVNTKSEHPSNWYLDLDQVPWRCPEILERCDESIKQELYPNLREQLHGPTWPSPHRVTPDQVSSYTVNLEIQKEAEKIRDQATAAVLKQYDKMFGTNFIPKKTVCERIAAFFKPLFTMRHHEREQ